MRSPHIPIKYVLHSLCLTILLAQTSCIRTDSLWCNEEDCTPEFCKEPIFTDDNVYLEELEDREKKIIEKANSSRHTKTALKNVKKLLKSDKISFQTLIKSLLDYLDNLYAEVCKQEQSDMQLGLSVNAKSLEDLNTHNKTKGDPIVQHMYWRLKNTLTPKGKKEKRAEKIAKRKKRITELLEMIFKDKDFENQVIEFRKDKHEDLYKRVIELIPSLDDTNVEGHSI